MNSSIPQTKKSRRNLFIVIGLLVIGLCLCSTICALTLGRELFNVMSERSKAEPIIEQFMRAMSNKDTATAYALLSTRAKTHFTLADIEKMASGNNYLLFNGYRSLTITNFNLRAGFNTNPDMPQGRTATVEGTLSYSGGFIGSFNAILEQEGEQW